MPLDGVDSNMVDDAPASPRLKCLNCGTETATETEQWPSIDYSPLGTLTQCPECGSTNVTSRR